MLITPSIRRKHSRKLCEETKLKSFSTFHTFIDIFSALRCLSWYATPVINTKLMFCSVFKGFRHENFKNIKLLGTFLRHNTQNDAATLKHWSRDELGRTLDCTRLSFEACCAETVLIWELKTMTTHWLKSESSTSYRLLFIALSYQQLLLCYHVFQVRCLLSQRHLLSIC